MKVLLRYINIVIVGIALFATHSCDVTDLDAKDSPNALVPANADLNFYTNSLQENYADLFEQINEVNMEPVRMMNMFGQIYFTAYGPTTYDGEWSTAYATILQDVVATEELVEERGETATNYAALAKIFKAMAYVHLVDMFGDVPFAEANQGAAFLNPNVTGGETIYNEMHTELDDAIALLEQDQTGKAIPVDWFYGTFSTSNWIAVANTIKMKMYLNTGNGGGFQAVLDDGRYIDDPSEDFQWFYSTVNLNPDSRHPQFPNNYDNGAGDYMSNDYMNEFLNGKAGVIDPRLRYYFYRQTTSDTDDPNELPCITFNRPNHYPADEVFCLVNGPNGEEGYWGRDHLDDDGIPPDNLLRTIWGLYPVGGKFDANDDVRGTITSGAQGAGISPVLLKTYVDFMRAEAAQTNLSNEDARALLEQAIRSSMDKVLNFNAEIGYEFTTEETAQLATQADVDAYVAAVLTEYDGANAANQLEIIVREYWLALFGNGMEAYNAYRRTGYPSDLQPTLNPSPGEFINSHLYASNFVNNNTSVEQKSSVGIPVFWQSITDLD